MDITSQPVQYQLAVDLSTFTATPNPATDDFYATVQVKAPTVLDSLKVLTSLATDQKHLPEEFFLSLIAERLGFSGQVEQETVMGHPVFNLMLNDDTSWFTVVFEVESVPDSSGSTTRVVFEIYAPGYSAAYQVLRTICSENVLGSLIEKFVEKGEGNL